MSVRYISRIGWTYTRLGKPGQSPWLGNHRRGIRSYRVVDDETDQGTPRHLFPRPTHPPFPEAEPWWLERNSNINVKNWFFSSLQITIIFTLNCMTIVKSTLKRRVDDYGWSSFHIPRVLGKRQHPQKDQPRRTPIRKETYKRTTPRPRNCTTPPPQFNKSPTPRPRLSRNLWG